MEKDSIVNMVTMSGTVISNFQFSHQGNKECFYRSELSVKRLSGVTDRIPVIVPEMLLHGRINYQGTRIWIQGEFRSYNLLVEGRTKLVLFVFAAAFIEIEDFPDGTNENEIFLEGYLCRPAIYRRTPLGREIADLIVAVNRPNGKSDYIPCIAWGMEARRAAKITTGNQIRISGRIQSREYTKRVSETECDVRTAYEVSISKLDKEEI